MEYVKNMDELGLNLYDMRVERGVSQQEIADILFMDRSTYAYYESGKSNIGVFSLIKLAKLYETDIRYFLVKGGERNVLR